MYGAICESRVGAAGMQTGDLIQTSAAVVDGTFFVAEAMSATGPEAIVVFTNRDGFGDGDRVAGSVGNGSDCDGPLASIERKEDAISTDISRGFVRRAADSTVVG